MIKCALIGLGGMGQGHVAKYKTLEAQGKIKLVAVCDLDEEKFNGKISDLNIDVGDRSIERGKYRTYTDYNELLEKEELDYVDIVLPTYLHHDVAIKAMEMGHNVLCEKPMSLSYDLCREMVETARRTGKKFMIAQCLRFWSMYEVLKKYVDDNTFGKVICGYFFRGGMTPTGGYQNWYLDEKRSGGAILDQHVHDVDMINYLFGIPEAVSSAGFNVFDGSGFDAVSTNYYYPDGKVINAQDDWTINGKYGFQMLYRVNFEKGSIIYDAGKVTIYPHEGDPIIPDLGNEDGYLREIMYFASCVENDLPIEICTPESTAASIGIACAEVESARGNGERVQVKLAAL